MATYLTYRNGNDNLDNLIKEAVTHFHKQYKRPPVVLVVHKTLVGKAKTIKAVTYLNIEVRGSGGCLVGEVWLDTDRKVKDGD